MKKIIVEVRHSKDCECLNCKDGDYLQKWHKEETFIDTGRGREAALKHIETAIRCGKTYNAKLEGRIVDIGDDEGLNMNDRGTIHKLAKVINDENKRLSEERKEIIEAFIKKLNVKDVSVLMNAISNQFGVEEIIDWLKGEGVI